MARSENPSRSLIWSLIESGGLSLLSLAALLVVARIVGPGELGAFAIAFGIVQILTLSVDMLVHDAIIQRRDLRADHLHAAFWTCLTLGLGLGLVCWLLAPAFGRLFDSELVAEILPVLGLGILFSGLGCVPVAALRREVRFKPLALRSLYGRLCGVIVAFAMAIAGYGVWSLVAQHLVQVAISTLLVWPASPWRPALRFSAARLGELVSYGVFAVGTRLVWVSSVRIFTLLVGSTLGVTAVGYLNIAQRIVDTLFDLLAGAANNLALPLFSRRQDDRAALVRAYSQATEFAALGTQPLFAGLALVAAPAILLLLGPAWLPAAPLVQVLAIAAMVQFLTLFGDTTILAMGRPGLLFALSLIALGYVVGAIFLLQPESAYAATLIWASRIAVVEPLLILIVCRLLGISPLDMLRMIWVPLVSAVAMAVTLFAVESFLLDGASALGKLLLMVPLGAVAYGLAVVLAGRESVGRLLQFAAAGLKRSGS